MSNLLTSRTKTLVLIVCVISLVLPPGLSTQAEESFQQAADCLGKWTVEPYGKDTRISVIPFLSAADECAGAFTLMNQTEITWRGITLPGSGYTLAIHATSVNTQANWTPPSDPDGTNYLTREIPLDVVLQPKVQDYLAYITVTGEITTNTLLLDSAIFLFSAGIDLANLPLNCVISVDQLHYATLRASDVLEPVVKLLLQRRFRDARRELTSRLPEFYERLGEYMSAQGVDCAADVIADKIPVLKNPLVVAKLVASYISWFSTVLTDYWKYKGAPVSVTISYAPNVIPATPTLNPSPTPVSSELPPLDRQDYYSVLQWVKYALETNDVNVFIKLVAENLAYVLYPEGGEDVTKDEFLRDLSKRLPSGPRCDSYTISGNTLDIQVSRWSPAWIIDEMCYGGCGPINPPITSNVIAFSFRKENNGWRLNKIALGERPDWWASTYNTPIVSCDTVQFSSFSSTVPTLTNIPSLDKAAYFSVLQWIKYAALNNDISVFENLIIGDSIQFFDGSGNAGTTNKADFLEELSKRLINKPNFEYILYNSSVNESGRLIIQTTNWSPKWDLNGGSVVYLILEMKNGQWVLSAIMFSDLPSSWLKDLEKISFESISLVAGSFAEDACEGVLPTRLKIDDFAFVSFYPPLRQIIRSGYGLENQRLDSIPLGSAMKIIDGPECANNMVWWRVKVMSSGLKGWTSEGQDGMYYLIPCESRENCGTQ